MYTDFMTFLVQEGIIIFFFEHASEGYAMADAFNVE
jgi:hypothetical protein